MKNIFTLTALLATTFSFSQNVNHAQMEKEKIFFEKTGLTLNDLREMAAHPEKKNEILKNRNENERNGNPNTQLSNEVIVSGSTDIESEIHAAMNPLDSTKIVCSPNTQNGSGLSNPIYYTGDFAQTWNPATFNNDPDISGGFTLGGGDPMFAFDNNGIAYYSWIRIFFAGSRVYAAIYWASSSDNGATWQRAANDRVAIDSSTSIITLPDKIFDKQWMIADRTSSSPYYNDLYCAMYQPQTSTGTTNIVVYKKPAAASAFNTTWGVVSDNTFMTVQFSDIVVDNSGNVHVTFFGSQDNVNYAIWHSVSTDGGATFSTPNKIADTHVPRFSADQPNANFVGIDPQRFYPCPHVAIDNSSGPNANNLYATWTANGALTANTTGLDIFFSRSTDGGMTWSTPVIVNNDTDPAADNFYSAITINTDGIIFLTWYDRRLDPVNNKTTHYYFAYSVDGGQTLLGNQQITNVATDFSTIGSQNSNFGIGEYTQVVAARGYAIPVWTDGRTNDGDLNIYCATIPWATYSGVHESVAVNHQHIIAAYPNPVSDDFFVTLHFDKEENVLMTITDVAGRMIEQNSWTSHAGTEKTSFDLTPLSAGEYFFTLQTSGTKETVRVTVK
ncbi:MAG: T9SS type A sorting domain-containing protein [Bacteroidetes bacterium]|nr:T9SS type A sorting domain-containing protein [Bacteroidota bacterium]